MKVWKNQYGELRSGWALVISMVLVMVGMMLPTLLFPAAGETAYTISSVAAQYIPYVLMALISMLLFACLYRRPLRHMGFVGEDVLPGFMHGLLLGLLTIALAYGALLLLGMAELPKAVFFKVDWLALLLDIGLFKLVALGQEIFLRGYMMTALKTTRNKVVILLLPSLIFAALFTAMNPGASWLAAVNVFLLGVLLAGMFVKSGKLWMPIGFHFAWNLAQGCLLGLPVSGMGVTTLFVSQLTGPVWLTGGKFGMEGGAMVTVVVLLCMLFVQFIVKSPTTPAWTLDSDLPLTRGK